MTVLIAITAVFLLLEIANVAALYFNPGSAMFNAVGVFRAWETSKEHPEVHDLVRYLTFWVAGTKLIFILLLGSVLIFGFLAALAVALGFGLTSL